MKQTLHKIRKAGFEARDLISFLIAGMVCFLSFVVFRGVEGNLILLGKALRLSAEVAQRFGYIIVALLMLLASLLRMWAGSHLSSGRIMAFRIRHDVLTTTGPFACVRNPVYLADLIAYTGFALCLNPAGFLLPVFIAIHYLQLIAYEEAVLQVQFGELYTNYKKSVSRLFPFPGILNRKKTGRFRISYDGFRHNSPYLLFIPGFVVASMTGSFLHAILIGIPGVIDWAIVHTVKGFAKTEPERTKKSKLSKSRVFSDILYAQCWEDPCPDLAAFNIAPDDVLFSVTSGGCNVLAFLAGNPSRIIALDINPSQNYLLELKMAAFKGLTYDELLEFLGVVPSEKRVQYYLRVRSFLSPDAAGFWDHHEKYLSSGIIHCGRYEGYMHLLRKWFNLVMGKSLTRDLMNARTAGERSVLYDKKWKNMRWRLFTRIFLSRPVMTLLFDKAFFAQLGESFSFGSHFEKIINRGITRFPLRENHFLSYILTGNYLGDCLPVYLKRENFEKIRSRLDRIEIVTGDCFAFFPRLPENSISKFNFTNIFEWMPAERVHQLLQETVRVAKNHSILTYRNLLVPRSRPETLSDRIFPEAEIADRLYETDRSFIYRKYVVEQIIKTDGIQCQEYIG